MSRAHKVPPVILKACIKLLFCVTLTWICNEVKVKIKDLLHTYNDCAIDWPQVQVCANR